MDLAACHSHALFGTVAADDEVDTRIDRTADALRYIFELHALRRRTVDGNEDIAALQARFFSRAAFHDAGDEDAVIGRSDIDADTGIGAAHLGREIFVQVTAEIERMLVAEGTDHALQGAVENGILIDILCIVAFNDFQGPEKFKHRRRPARIVPEKADHGDNHNDHAAADIAQRPADPFPGLA